MELALAIAAPLVTAALIGLFSWILRKALQDLKERVAPVQQQVQPNGGGSLFDYAKKAMEASQRAVDVSLATDAKVKDLERKLDAFLLSRIP